MVESTPNTSFSYDFSGLRMPQQEPQSREYGEIAPVQPTQGVSYDFSQVPSANEVRGFFPSLGMHTVNALNVMADGIAYAVDEVAQASRGVANLELFGGTGYLEGYRRSEREFEQAYGTTDPSFMDHVTGVGYVLGLHDVNPQDLYRATGRTAGQLADDSLTRDLGDDKIVSDTIGFLSAFATSPGAAIGKVGMQAGRVGASAPVRLTAQAAKNWVKSGMKVDPQAMAQLVREGQVLSAAMSNKGWLEMGRRAQKMMAPTTRIGRLTDDAAGMAGGAMAQMYMMSPEDERMHQMHAALMLTPFMLPMQRVANKIGSKIVSRNIDKLNDRQRDILLRAADQLRNGEIDMQGMANAYYKVAGVGRQATALGLSSAFEGTAFMALDSNARQLAYDWIAKGDFDAGRQLGRAWLGTAMGVAFLKGRNITHEQTNWFRQIEPELNTLETWMQAEANKQAMDLLEKTRAEDAAREARLEERLADLTEPQRMAEAGERAQQEGEQRRRDLGVDVDTVITDSYGWATGETLSALRGTWTPELVPPAQEGQTGNVRLRFGQDHSVVLRQENGEPVLEVADNVRQVMRGFGRDPGTKPLRGDAARRALDDLAMIGMVQKSGSAINFQRLGMQEVQPGEFAYPGDMKLHSAGLDGTTVARTASYPQDYKKVETLQTHGDQGLEPLTDNPVLDAVYDKLGEASVANPDPLRDAIIHNALHMARFSNTKAGVELRKFFQLVPPEKIMAQMEAGDPMVNLTMDLGSIAANTGNADHAIRVQRMRPIETGRVPGERYEQFGQDVLELPTMEAGPPREQVEGPPTRGDVRAEAELQAIGEPEGMEAAAAEAPEVAPSDPETAMRYGRAGNRQRVREQVLEAFEGVEGNRQVQTSPDQKRLLTQLLPSKDAKGQTVKLRQSAASKPDEMSMLEMSADDARSVLQRWAERGETMTEAGEMSPREADVMDGWMRRTAQQFGIDVGAASPYRRIEYLSLSQRIALGQSEAASLQRRQAYARRGRQQPGEVEMPGAEDPVAQRFTPEQERQMREEASVAEALKQKELVARQVEAATKQSEQRQPEAQGRESEEFGAGVFREPVSYQEETGILDVNVPEGTGERVLQARRGELADERGLVRDVGKSRRQLLREGKLKEMRAGVDPVEVVEAIGSTIQDVAGAIGKTSAGRAIRRGYEFLVEDPAVTLERAGVEMGGRAKVVRQDQQKEEAAALRMSEGMEKLYNSKNKQTRAQLKAALEKEVPIPDSPDSMTRTRVADLMDGKIEPRNDTERKIQEEGQKFAKTLRNKSAEAGLLQAVSDSEGNVVLEPIRPGERGVMQYVGGRDRGLVFDKLSLRKAFFNDLAEANPEYIRDAKTGRKRRKTGVDLENEYNEQKAEFSNVVVKTGERQAAVEFSRRFKNYPVYWTSDASGKTRKYEMLEPNPLAVMRVMAQQQTGRIATAREFGVHAGGQQTREQLLAQAQREGWGKQYEVALEKGGVPMHVKETVAGIGRLGIESESDVKALRSSVEALSERMQGREPTNTYQGGVVSANRDLQGLRSAALSSFSFVRDIPDFFRGAYLLSARRFFTSGMGRMARNWSETKELAEREGLVQAQTMDWMFQESRSQGVEKVKNWTGKLASWSEQVKTLVATSTADLSLRAVESGKASPTDLTFFELANVSAGDMAAIREANLSGQALDPQVRSRALKAGVELLTSRTRKGEYSQFAENQLVSDLMVFQRFATKRAQQHGQIIGEALRGAEKVRHAETPEAKIQAKKEARAAVKRMFKSVAGVALVGVMGDMLTELLVGMMTEGDPIEPIQKFYNAATASPSAFMGQLGSSFRGQVVGGLASTFARIAEDPTSGQAWAGATTPTALYYAAATSLDADGSAIAHFIDKSGLVPFSRISRGWARVLQGENLDLRDISNQVYDWRRNNDAMPASGGSKNKPEEFYEAVRGMKNTLYSTGFDVEKTLRQGADDIRQALDLAPESSVAASIRGHRLVANLTVEQRDDLFKSINDSDRIDAIIEYDNAMTDLAEAVGKMEGKRSSIDEYQEMVDMVSQQAALGVDSEWRGLADEALDITGSEIMEGIRNGERLQLLARAYANYPEHLDEVFTGKELFALQNPRLGTNRRQSLIYRMLMRRAITRMKSNIQEDAREQRMQRLQIR